ncbi:enoyl ACP reductase FabMG family protein [Thauera sp. SDU_THAU2]|uniref:enoyl ACP reductase FabMG family protein n=1 Tax=Thauera sp. SDU_THAU2 TaxID=3136633 RepID=UPI00311D8AEC
MNKPISLTQLPQTNIFRKGDVFVLFGELFGRGYASGLVNEARKAGMDIVGITVGRRDENNALRPLNDEELAAAEANLGGRIINVPLMAGFDLDAPAGEPTPTELLNKMTLKSWEQDKLDWAHIEKCRELGTRRFQAAVAEVMARIDGLIGDGRNVLFAHTMAGGIPRAKVFMVIANRIYKGRGERFMPSQTLLDSDLGKLILQNFDEVSAITFQHLIEGSAAIRARVEASGGQVRYSAYGYHGTEILIDGRYQWQTYTNYTQGYAKMRLERIAQAAWDQGVKATVYNCPEIRTNSTDVFAGVELPLISLLQALQHEGGGAWAASQWEACRALLADGHTLEEVLQKVADFQGSETMQGFRDFAAWPQPNSQAQADLQIGTSEDIVQMHKDRSALITDLLSSLVLEASGALILREASAPTGPVLWLNHDIIARQLNQLHA